MINMLAAASCLTNVRSRHLLFVHLTFDVDQWKRSLKSLHFEIVGFLVLRRILGEINERKGMQKASFYQTEGK